MSEGHDGLNLTRITQYPFQLKAKGKICRKIEQKQTEYIHPLRNCVIPPKTVLLSIFGFIVLS